ncbi:MAG: FkbM family methyltransferase [Chitinophagales bacterium]
MPVSPKKIFWKTFNSIDAALKFPGLKPGEIAVQLGFDMSAPVTSDLFLLEKRVRPGGIVFGIDPDRRNVEIAQKIIDDKKLNIRLINMAVYSEKGTTELLLGKKTSWNQLKNIPLDTEVEFEKQTVKIEMDSFDSIVKNYGIDIQAISHINITVNGAEYFALKGMEKLLNTVKDISITAVAGRYDDSGTINGTPDHILIADLLKKSGFKVRFKRIHQSFWWGFIVNFLIKGKWVFGKNNYGIIMAAKGNKKLKWYQSFS